MVSHGPPTTGNSAQGARLSVLPTNDLDEACTTLGKVFRSHRMEFTKHSRGLAVAHEGFSCGRVSFHRLRYGGDVRLVAPEMGDFYLFQLAMSGPFRISRDQTLTDVAEGQAYAVNPSEPFNKDWVPQGDQLIIRIERTALEEHARTLIGPNFNEQVLFKPLVVDAMQDRLYSLAQYVRNLPAAPPRVRRQVEDVVISTMLMTFPNSASDLLTQPERGCAPFYVRRVEEAIDGAPLTDRSLDDMAKLAGVSLRTLYYGFRRFRNTTPLVYLKEKRLDIARQKLLDGDPRVTTVTSVALECGFTHLAKFASNFRRRFGRSPSSVLRFKE